MQPNCNVLLTGKAWLNNMYVNVPETGSNRDEHLLTLEKDSMIPTLPGAEQPPQPLLIMFTHQSQEDAVADSAKPPTRRELEIGCIKSNQVKKLTGEFSIDTLPGSNPFSKCFTFDMLKVV